MLSVVDGTLRSQPFSSPRHTLAAGIDEYLFKSPRFLSSISIARDTVKTSVLNQIPAGAIVHLHGTNGTLSMTDIKQLSISHTVVWTLHDMNPFTGGCHYSLGCEGFEKQCSTCPAVRPAFRGLAEKTLQAKRDLWEKGGSIRLVAPTQWLADTALSSSILREQNVRVIPNPLPPQFDGIPLAEPVREAQTKARIVLGVVAADLSDPVKNVWEAVSAVDEARQDNPGLELRLVGARGAEHSGSARQLGVLTAEELKVFYSECDALILPSLAENGPLVIAEAGSQGCMTFARDTGGNSQMIRWVGEGATYDSRSQLVALLQRIQPTSLGQRRAVHQQTQKVFGSSAIADEYNEVYSSQLG